MPAPAKPSGLEIAFQVWKFLMLLALNVIIVGVAAYMIWHA